MEIVAGAAGHTSFRDSEEAEGQQFEKTVLRQALTLLDLPQKSKDLPVLARANDVASAKKRRFCLPHFASSVSHQITERRTDYVRVLVNEPCAFLSLFDDAKRGREREGGEREREIEWERERVAL